MLDGSVLTIVVSFYPFTGESNWNNIN